MDVLEKDVSRLLDASLSQNNRRSSYLQRLGIQTSDDADKSSTGDISSNSSSSSDSSSTVDSRDTFPQDDFRNKFLRKLAYSNVWVPQARRSPKHQVVTIFDWDDTVLPTTWLRNEYGYDPDEYGHESDNLYFPVLQKIVQHAKSMLEMAIKAGRTYIVTNAGGGWVEYSAARWAPE